MQQPGVYQNGTVVDPPKNLTGVTYRFNATWKPNSDDGLALTVSRRGLPPGRHQPARRFRPYEPDYLTSRTTKSGFETTLANGPMINGAIYRDWNKFQFSYHGPKQLHHHPTGPMRDLRVRS